MSRTMIVVAVVTVGMLAGAVWFAQPAEQPTLSVDTASAVASPQESRARVLFGAIEIHVDVADTPEKRQQGLSGRRMLPEGEGMLFVFDESGYYSFWMPDMYIAIDILWLDESGQVVYLKENATPESFPEHYRPDTPARYVLEAPSGYARAHGIQVGSQATIELPAT